MQALSAEATMEANLGSFPHHNARYENDDRQATLTILLIGGFVLALLVWALLSL